MMPESPRPSEQPFLERIHAIYDRCPLPIHPLVGSAFLNPTPSDLRIMAVGISSYVSPDAQGTEMPAWFASWFRDQPIATSAGHGATSKLWAKR